MDAATRPSASYAQRIAFVSEMAARLHRYGTTAQRLEAAVTALSQRLDLECEAWSNPTGLILSFNDPGKPLGSSDTTRVILFCDVERPLRTPLARSFNRAVSRVLGQATASQNLPEEKVGSVNRLYAFAHRMGEAKKRFKRAHPMAYRYGRLLLGLLLLAWLVAPLL